LLGGARGPDEERGLLSVDVLSGLQAGEDVKTKVATIRAVGVRFAADGTDASLGASP